MSASQDPNLLENFGVTTNGFRRPGSQDLWEAAVAEAERVFQKELSSPTSAELQYVEALVLWMDTTFEQLEALYYSAYYDHAVEEQLDNLLALVGFRRLEEQQATGKVQFEATGGSASSDVQIPAGTTVKTESDDTTPPIYFQTTEPAVIATGDQYVRNVPVQGLDPRRTTLDLSDAQTGEETNLNAGAILLMHDSVRGVGSVTQPQPTGDQSEGFQRGRDRETDTEFRQRYENATSLGGTATLEAIEAGIRVSGDGTLVRSVTVSENLPITEQTAGDGSTYYEGRQVEPYVVLSESSQATYDIVSQAILDNRAGGIESVGSTTGTALLSDGTPYDTGVAFTEASTVDVYIDATITVTDEFPSDGEARIVANLLDTIGGLSGDGRQISGTEIGENVSYVDIVADVIDRDIPGVVDVPSGLPNNDIFVGTSANPTAAGSVTISEDQVARTAPDNINIALVAA